MKDSDFIERFEAFARSKPAGEEYRVVNEDRCALALFGYPGARDDNLDHLGIPKEAFDAAIGRVPGDNTFGALADRLAALRAPANA